MTKPIYHNHHIVPKHMNGKDIPSNIKRLTVRQHSLAHKKLWKQFGHWQDYIAWKALSGQFNKSDIIAELHKHVNVGRKASKETRKLLSEQRKGKLNGFYGKKHSENSKQIMSSKHSGKKLSKIHKKRIGISGTGRKHSIKTKRKMAESRRLYWKNINRI